MKVTSRISLLLDSHGYPALFYRFPILVRCIYALNFIFILRNWYVHRTLRKVEKIQSTSFSALDAGCGMGEFALGIAKRNLNAQVVGIDFTASNRPLANRVAESLNLINIEFRQGDLTTLSEVVRYDIILCISTLQFIKEDTRALRNIRSALKPHGTFLLYVPITYKRYFPWTETIEQKYLSDFLYKYHDDFSMHRYTTNEVLKKIQQDGFNIKSTEYAYGACGAIALELSFLILAAVKRLPMYISLVFVLIYACAIFPIQLVFMLIDFVLPKSTGNGLLIIAEKAHNSSLDSSG